MFRRIAELEKTLREIIIEKNDSLDLELSEWTHTQTYSQSTLDGTDCLPQKILYENEHYNWTSMLP